MRHLLRQAGLRSPDSLAVDMLPLPEDIFDSCHHLCLANKDIVDEPKIILIYDPGGSNQLCHLLQLTPLLVFLAVSAFLSSC